MQLKKREILAQDYANVCTMGNFQKVQCSENSAVFQFEKGKIEISYFDCDIIKVFIGEKDEESQETGAVVNNLGTGSFTLEERDIEFVLKGKRVITTLNKLDGKVNFYNNDWTIICEDFNCSGKDENGNIIISKINDALGYYGFGEKGDTLNKKGKYIENYNTDDPETDDKSFLFYKTIPFFTALKENSAYGIYFDNSFRSYFDMGNSYEDRIFFGADGGQIQYYFLAGDDIKDIEGLYARITGTMDMPALWTLGYQQCRYSYYSRKEVEELVDTFTEKGIPLDTVYLDIDYMNGYRVFTFNEDKFPKPKEMIENLRKKGIKIVTIVDPGVKIDEEYEVYNRGIKGDCFVRKHDGELYTGDVWAGESAFPDFANKNAREWWKKEIKEFLKLGIAGIWNDMNEPAVFNPEYATMPESCLHFGDNGVMEHKEFHNKYGFEMTRCSKEAQEESGENLRSFSMTRATFAGGQRFSSIWTGDNRSRWDQMRMSLPMNSNLGISGFAYVGNDIGGFGEDTNEELFIRWMELGTFLPIMRNHSAVFTRRQEPWSFGKRAENISKKAIMLRYKLIPYLYNMFYKAHLDGIPVFRPMISEYCKDMKLLNMKEQFMFGDSMLIAPVLHEGERSKVVYLPKGRWYNFFTNECFEGEKYYTIDVPLDEIPVFVQEGSIIPVYEEEYMNLENTPLKTTFYCYGKECDCIYYEDDGSTMDYKKGKYNLLEIKVKAGEAVIDYKHRGFEKEVIFDFKYI